MEKKEFGCWWFGFFIGVMIMLIIIGALWTYEQKMDEKEIQPLNQFCQERGYVEYSHTERWDFKEDEVLSILCLNDKDEIVFVESIDVYNEVFNKPR